MTVTHARFSDAPDDGTPRIQGADWNAPHAYGPGTIMPIAIAKFAYDADTDVMSYEYASPRIIQEELNSNYVWINFSIDDIAISDSAAPPTYHFLFVPGKGVPSNIRFPFSDRYNEAGFGLEIYDADGYPVEKFPVSCKFSVIVYMEIGI